MGYKAVPYSTIVCGQNCEGCGNVCISAPNDATYSTTFTSVDFASYGTPNGGCGSFTYGGCHAGSSYGIVYNTFIGGTSGCVNPVNGVFGDPCRGTYKRLYIQLTASGTQQVFVPIPTINSFVASPSTQSSGSNGTPAYDTILSWTTTNGSNGSASITSSAGETFTVSSLGGTLNITNLPQSTAGSTSPATRTYTLTVKNELNESVTSTITVSAYNDNVPNDFTLPATTTIGTSLSSLEPNIEYKVLSPGISGIDMITAVSSLSAGLDLSLDGASWASTVFITNNQAFYLRFTSQPFNTDPSGLTNPITYNYKVGTLSKSFTATTRAPDVGEFFDFGNATTNYPYPDIDQVANTPSQYIQSPTVYTVGDSGKPPDAEIPVEIKVSDPNAQIRITPAGSIIPGSWQTPRST
jgi:hypothetical protein